jgi:hypothetical protein
MAKRDDLKVKRPPRLGNAYDTDLKNARISAVPMQDRQLPIYQSDQNLREPQSASIAQVNHLPDQQAVRFSRNAEIPSCASTASEFMLMISLAYA